MRALICDDYQGIEALRVGELPEPEAAPGTLLVRVESAAVNFADTLMVAGQYQIRPALPFAPGYELSGTVVDTGGSSDFSPGDRICGFAPFGAMAELVKVMPENAAPIPDGISFEEGSVLPATYGTSYHALVDRAVLQEGESLLVLGAAGGVGLAAVQVGKLLGGRVIGAVSSEEKAELIRDAGADDVIRYDEENLREGIKRTAGPAGVDVVYDAVGGEATEAALRATGWNGRLLVVGFASGTIPSIPLNLMLLKGNSVVGVFWGRFTAEEPARARANLDRIVSWVEAGDLKPFISKAFPLDQGREAMQLVAGRRSLGRVVVTP